MQRENRRNLRWMSDRTPEATSVESGTVSARYFGYDQSSN